ncbi:unnamed protein product, partial [Owenia fusiformis]
MIRLTWFILLGCFLAQARYLGEHSMDEIADADNTDLSEEEERGDDVKLYDQYPEAKSGFFEGDIRLPEKTKRKIGSRKNTRFRNALAEIFWSNSLWPRGRVPYTLDSSYTNEEKKTIKFAMRKIEEETRVGDTNCITFYDWEEKNDTRYKLDIVNAPDDKCSSTVGFTSTMSQSIELASSCINWLPFGYGTAMHELLHSLGLWHEHTRPDRDKFVKILYDNIEPESRTNYVKQMDYEVKHLTKYDYYSIMHYGIKTGSKNLADKTIETMVILDKTVKKDMVGQRTGLTIGDIIELQILYGCKDIDECKPEVQQCSLNAECSNTIGSFTCNCNPGYDGDGIDCTKTDPCEDNNIEDCATIDPKSKIHHQQNGCKLTSCDKNAKCLDKEGKEICTCNDGYSGNGITCKNINECIVDSNICHT